MKTAISLPDALFEAAENLAKRLGMSRSELYATALDLFVRGHRGRGVTDKLNEIYGSEGGTGLEGGYRQLQSASLPDEDWSNEEG